MDNLVFAIWIMGWPAACAIEDYLSHLTGRSYGDGTRFLAAVIRTVVWVMVAAELHP